MASEEDIKKRIFEYVRDGQKLKLCILDSALKKEKFSVYEITEAMSHYYPIKLFTINEAYETLKKEGFIAYDSTLMSETLVNKNNVSYVFQQYRDLIEPLLNKNYCGKGDMVGTVGEEYLYLIKKLFIRGGTASEETLMSDIQRDIFAGRAPSRYSAYKDDFPRVINLVQTDLTELRKRKYITVTPRGYVLPDFIFNNILSDPDDARDLFNTLSLDLWMAFDFQAYLSNLVKIENKFPKVSNNVSEAVRYFQQNRFNDALDYLNSACEELTGIIYAHVVGEKEKAPASPHAKLVKIWEQQDLWKDDPALSELGKRAAVFLSSAIFIPKWVRDKTSHPLAAPTADSVRLALASLLIAIDVAIKLKLLE